MICAVATQVWMKHATYLLWWIGDLFSIFFLPLRNTLHVLRLDQTHRLDMHSERERTIKINRFLLCPHSNSIHCAHDIHCPSATFTSCDSPPVESPSQWFFEGRLHSSFVCRCRSCRMKTVFMIRRIARSLSVFLPQFVLTYSSKSFVKLIYLSHA